jgi:thiamine-phosphate diphosphorylase
VHLPSTGLQAAEIRSWLPKDFLFGISVHSMHEIRRACAQRIDYILLGHLFPTASKQGYGSPLGLDYLRKACSGVETPILGLGGIKPESVRMVLEAGAAGIAGISLFQNSADFKKLRTLFHAAARRA